jgi:hypothetical protein
VNIFGIGVLPTLHLVVSKRQNKGPSPDRQSDRNVLPSSMGDHVKIVAYLFVGMNVALAPLLWGDPPNARGSDDIRESALLVSDEKKLEKMEARRTLDHEKTRLAQEEFQERKAEITAGDEQKIQDMETLESIETFLMALRKEKVRAYQFYKKLVHQYGVSDSRSAAAKDSWKDSHQAVRHLQKSRRILIKDIHQGGRQVHNDKTLQSLHKQTMNSAARYRAIDDRKIRNIEKSIADRQSGLPVESGL